MTNSCQSNALVTNEYKKWVMSKMRDNSRRCEFESSVNGYTLVHWIYDENGFNTLFLECEFCSSPVSLETSDLLCNNESCRALMVLSGNIDESYPRLYHEINHLLRDRKE